MSTDIMRMLKWINDNTRKLRFRMKLAVSIDEKIRESCLRWFGHVQRRAINVLVRKSEWISGWGSGKM